MWVVIFSIALAAFVGLRGRNDGGGGARLTAVVLRPEADPLESYPSGE
jgi:hypothetical protein